MKILMVTMALGIGGAETHIVELASGLVRRGHTVAVISGGGVYEEKLHQNGVQTYTAPLDTKNPKAMLTSYNAVLRVLRDAEKSGAPYDVIHAHARIPGFICGFIKKKLGKRITFVTTAHGVFEVTPIYKLLTNWGERSLAVSEDVKQYLMKNYGIAEKNIALTVNGIDTSRFSDVRSESNRKIRSDVIAEFGLAPDCSHRLVHVSRLDNESTTAAFGLIESAERVCEKYPDYEILMIGDGTAAERLKAEADKANEKLGRKVTVFTGARTDIDRLLTAGDIFLGVSRAALEAICAHLPTVLAGAQGYLGLADETNVDSAVDTNFCCRGLPLPTADDIYSSLDLAFSLTPERRELITTVCRDVVIRNYSITRMCDDAEKLYKGFS